MACSDAARRVADQGVRAFPNLIFVHRRHQVYRRGVNGAQRVGIAAKASAYRMVASRARVVLETWRRAHDGGPDPPAPSGAARRFQC